MAAAPDDAAFMRRALELAEAGWGKVHPNPLVGAVVVRDGEVVGEGAHLAFGAPHAEAEALRVAGDRAAGATLYVTLEPCAHQGKTPPCTDAILRAGVRRVVYAAADPHPRAGGGAARLRQAGLEVDEGIERGRARAQNALFFGPLERGRSFVALKYGMTLDARLARPGESTRITGPQSEREVHRLRAGFGAILVGGRTARIDDPRLTVRLAPPPRVPPVRVVASAAAELPLDGRLVGSAGDPPVWVLAGAAAPRERVEALARAGVRVVACAAGEDGRLDLADGLRRLREEGVSTVLCEGGGRLGAALLGAGLLDRLYLFIAPTVFGACAVPAFPGEAGSAVFRPVEARLLGADTLLTLDRSD